MCTAVDFVQQPLPLSTLWAAQRSMQISDTMRNVDAALDLQLAH